MLNIGDKSPNFTLPNHNGELVSLSDFNDQKVIIWFFPKANTPGWTNEGIGFRDELEKYNKLNIDVIGVSADSPKKQKKFVDKYNFNYPMLCDESHEMLEQYGVWGLKKFMGKEYMGISRITYVLDVNHNIVEVFDKVNTKSHASDILNTLWSFNFISYCIR